MFNLFNYWWTFTYICHNMALILCTGLQFCFEYLEILDFVTLASQHFLFVKFNNLVGIGWLLALPLTLEIPLNWSIFLFNPFLTNCNMSIIIWSSEEPPYHGDVCELVQGRNNHTEQKYGQYFLKWDLRIHLEITFCVT